MKARKVHEVVEHFSKGHPRISSFYRNVQRTSEPNSDAQRLHLQIMKVVGRIPHESSSQRVTAQTLDSQVPSRTEKTWG